MGTASCHPINAPAQAARQGREAAFRNARRSKPRLADSRGETRGVGCRSERSVARRLWAAGRSPTHQSRSGDGARSAAWPAPLAAPDASTSRKSYFVAIGLSPRDSRFRIPRVAGFLSARAGRSCDSGQDARAPLAGETPALHSDLHHLYILGIVGSQAVLPVRSRCDVNRLALHLL